MVSNKAVPTAFINVQDHTGKVVVDLGSFWINTLYAPVGFGQKKLTHHACGLCHLFDLNGNDVYYIPVNPSVLQKTHFANEEQTPKTGSIDYLEWHPKDKSKTTP